MDISSLRPILDKHNVRLVGVGLGYNSLDGFMESGCWKGNELYVDEGKDLYQALNLGKGGLKMLGDPNVKAASVRAKKRGVVGNLKGDGMQLGGTYIVDKNGKVLLEFQQQAYGEHPSPESILRALGLESEVANIPTVQKIGTGVSQA
mmetsp:Transcript_10465/g.18456  ORF Transcript_10465/g.18456 Transcript_10465/m.18456 type:complete len:148 (+) Transcript_10465:275-718(+)